MTIYVITYLYRRDYGDPCVKMYTDLHQAQAAALALIQEFKITNDDFLECHSEYGLESIWQLDDWQVYTSDRRFPDHDVYIDFETRILNLPQE